LHHWYGLAILKKENNELEFTFIDSLGVPSQFLEQGANQVANKNRLKDNNEENIQIYALINQLLHEGKSDQPFDRDRRPRPAAAAHAAANATVFKPITFHYLDRDFMSKRIGHYGTISIRNFTVANPERASSKISYEFDSYNYEGNNTVGFVIGSADQDGLTVFGLSAAYNTESSDDIDQMQAETVAKEWVQLLYQVHNARNLDWHDHTLYHEATNMLHDIIKAERDKPHSLLGKVVATGTIGVLYNGRVTFAHVGDAKMVAYRGSQDHKVYQIIAENSQDLRPGKKIIPSLRTFGARTKGYEPAPEIITVDVEKNDIIVIGSRNFWENIPVAIDTELNKQDRLKDEISLASGELGFIKKLALEAAKKSSRLYGTTERSKDAITVLGIKIK
jgi:serine/threonine protein phosphatase PrpC